VYRDIENKVKQHIDSLNLDLRVNDNHRFTDQKCKPDVISAVAESILFYIDDEADEFTCSDIRTSKFSNDTMVNLFQKPDIGKKTTEKEYDKVFSQPIRMFWTAGILSKVGKRRNAYIYQVSNRVILEYIAMSDQRALNFLCILLEKVIRDSELKAAFDKFFNHQDATSFAKLKEQFTQTYLNYTSVKKTFETARIFPQVINPLAFCRKSKGTEKGRLSKQPVSYSSLCYNRVNFRDIEKPKGLSRAEFAETQTVLDTDAERYQVDRAKRKVRQYHSQDDVASNEVYIHDGTPHMHAHHIFPVSLFPELSDTFENLVLINPTQHNAYAHPNGDTRTVSKSYQLLCLIAKLSSIKLSEIKNDSFYSIHRFIEMVNTGLDEDLLEPSMPIELIQKQLADHYVTR
jgi:hypothetical protein